MRALQELRQLARELKSTQAAEQMRSMGATLGRPCATLQGVLTCVSWGVRHPVLSLCMCPFLCVLHACMLARVGKAGVAGLRHLDASTWRPSAIWGTKRIYWTGVLILAHGMTATQLACLLWEQHGPLGGTLSQVLLGGCAMSCGAALPLHVCQVLPPRFSSRFVRNWICISSYIIGC